MMDTYPAPRDGWVCWHCGIRCRTPAAARLHFGPRPTSRPACLMSSAELRTELRMLRVLEEAVADRADR